VERASQQCWARPDVLAPVKPPVFAVDGSTELPVGQGFACSMNWLIDLPHLVPPHLRRPGPVVSPARSRAVRGEGEGVTATDQPRRQRHETHLTCPGPHSTIGGASSARRGSRPGERTRSAEEVLGNPLPWHWSPRCWWCWTSLSSTRRCRPSARTWSSAAGIRSGSSPRTCSCPAADCCSAGGSRTCSPGDAFC